MTYFFRKYYWFTKNWNMVNFRTESPIATSFSVQFGDISNFDESEKNI